jgi:glycosyltransferase involved in cell wall biosynthesis
MPYVSVVIPALNEAEIIARTVQAIPAQFVSEIIVVDNGSTDGTAEAASRAGARVVREPARGYGRACAAGFRSVSAGCEIIVQMDADLSDDPSQIPLLIEPIVSAGYDLVLGSRLLGRREPHSLTGAQIFGSWLASRLIRLLYGMSYTDMGPFRAIRRSVADSLELSEQTYGWSIEMQSKAAARGLRVKEIPVSWRNRAAGESKVAGDAIASVKAGFRIVWTILKVSLSESSRRTRKTGP